MASAEKRKYENNLTAEGQNETNLPENTQEEKGENQIKKVEMPYIVFDCETTGLDEEKDRIIQLAMIKVFPTTKDQIIYEKLFNPEVRRENQITAYKIHKISPDILLTEKPFQFYAEEILEFLNGVQYLVGHNILFDLEFLTNAFKRLGLNQKHGIPWVDLLKRIDFSVIDTFKMSIYAFPALERNRLVDIANHLGIETTCKKVISYSVSSPKKKKQDPVKMITGEGDGLHNAVMDVLVTNEIFLECIEELKRKQPDIINQTILLDSRYTYRLPNLEIIDRAIVDESSITSNDKEAIKFQAESSMSALRYTKRRFLKDLSKSELLNDISFLKKGNGVANKREVKLREILLNN